MYKRFIILLLLFCGVFAVAHANVSVSAGAGGTGICSNKAVTGSAPAFTALGSILITEGSNSDFSIGTSVIILVPPTGWQFSTTLPAITYITGSNISGIASTISSTALTLNVTVVNTNGADQITITGLQVQPTTTSAGSGSIRASVASGVAGIATGSSGTNFASLSVNAPATATVSIASTPSGSFCPGTNVTFIPTSSSGGTPTYTWSLNGADVSIGSTYSNSTLTSGNTVSCRMSSSLGCLIANPVYSNTFTATVLSAPAAITGSNSVCPGVSTALSTSTTGGAWSSSNTAVGSVNTTGLVTGITAGTTKISYTAGGCAAVKVVYVNNPPFAPALTPTVSTICNGSSMSITAGGTPASSTIISQNFNTGIAPWTVDTAGSINILSGSEWKACADSYLNEMGWYRSPDFTTFAMANADTSGSSSTLSAKLVSPSFSLAEYSSATLTFQHSYDYWPSGDVYVNLEISTNGGSTWTTINNFAGATIGTKMSFVSQSFSLNAYLGNANVKIRFYYRSTFGYYWAIENVLITGTPAVVTPTWSPVTHLFTNSTLTTAYTAGTAVNTVYVYPTTVTTPATVVYTATATTGACSASSTSTVNINPVPGSTTGALNVCVGGTSALTNSAGGGTWLSANTSIATVGSTTGIVTGVAAGTATISYISGSSCASLAVVTVNTSTSTITGNPNVCIGYTSTLANATTGGTWSSSNTSIATVGSSSGIVSGISYGTARITYSLGASCTTNTVITVQPLPAAITGPAEVCASETITLSDVTSMGIWLSGTSSVATVGSLTGVVTGVAAGTANISYVLVLTGCFAISNVTVNPVGPITGSSNACLGTTLALGNATSGGTWVSGTTSVATIDGTTGVLTPLTIGTTNITYTLPTGCVVYKTITVNTLPSDITGGSMICAGGTVTLSNATSGGTWSSSNTAVAGVGSSSGIVYGSTGGTTIITYTAPTGCIKTFTVTVNPPPSAITGSAAICVGFSSALSNASSGGTWSSSNSSVASVDGTGHVLGVTSGTAIITYTLTTGCFGIRGVTVNALPAAIAGAGSICQGVNTTLTNATGGGTWSSSNTTVATIDGSSGVVLGGASGTTTITYALPTACIATTVFTVNALPASITGPASVCTGSTAALSTAATGGSWSSSSTGLATVNTSGVVSGVASGIPVITYTLGTSCYTTKAMTVYASPAAITGTASVCKDLTTTLSDATSGGIWNSGNTSIATAVSGTGVVSGIAAGTADITYTLPTGCFASTTVTVLPLPASITGNLSLCFGLTSALANATSGGSWSSSASSVASIGSSTGIATGSGLGMATISYTLPTGCYITGLAVVNPVPSAISGAAAVCEGSSTLFTDASSGGSWSSSATGIANIGSSSGAVTGVAAGIATISYILPTGCAATQLVTVNPLPSAITGPNNICQTASATLTSAGGIGGVWSSSTLAVATVGASSGLMYGVAGGGAVITYT
jgi:trimeric autotransporter adhesin